MAKKSIMLLLAALLPLLPACGEGTQKDATATPGAPIGQAAAETKKEPVDLTFYNPATGFTEAAFMEKYGKALQQKFPYMRLHYIQSGKGTSLPELIAAGTAVDVVLSTVSNLHSTFLASHMEYDLTGLIKKYGIDLNQFEPASVELMKQISGGGMYGLPNSAGAGIHLLYNKDIFDRFGVAYPRDGMTWDELYELAKKMTRTMEGINYTGFGTSFQHIYLTNQLSASGIDPKTNKSLFASDEKWTAIAQNMLRFYQIPGNQLDAGHVSQSAQLNAFIKDHTTAMYVGGWIPADNVDYDWGIVRLPEFTQLPGVGTQVLPEYYLVSNTSKYKDDAFQAIAYLTTSKDFAVERAKKGDISALKPTAEIKKVLYEDVPYLKQSNIINARTPEKYAAPSLMTPYNAIAVSKFASAMESLITGKVTDINTALRMAAEETDKAIMQEKP